MAFDEKQRDRIFGRTNGHCHICREKLAHNNYAASGRLGAWEVDHSNPKANGGSDRLNNFYAACISCNRSKGAAATRTAPSRNGFRAAPLSRQKKAENTLVGGTVGLFVGRALISTLGPAGMILGAVLGALAGSSYEPE